MVVPGDVPRWITVVHPKYPKQAVCLIISPENIVTQKRQKALRMISCVFDVIFYCIFCIVTTENCECHLQTILKIIVNNKIDILGGTHICFLAES